MTVIGITGPTGAGKTTAPSFFRSMAPVSSRRGPNACSSLSCRAVSLSNSSW